MAKTNIKNLQKELDAKITTLKEVKKIEEYKNRLADMAKVLLNNDEAQVDVQLYIKVSIPENKNSKESALDASSLLEKIKSSESPEDFMETLNSMEDSIQNKKKEDKPSYYDINLEDLDNKAFMPMVDKLISSYKSTIKSLLTKIND